MIEEGVDYKIEEYGTSAFTILLPTNGKWKVVGARSDRGRAVQVAEVLARAVDG